MHIGCRESIPKGCEPMYPYPPIYPQPFDCCGPCRPPKIDSTCPWDLAPANMTATVLGIDNCGGIIIRLTRGCEAPCRKPARHCR